MKRWISTGLWVTSFVIVLFVFICFVSCGTDGITVGLRGGVCRCGRD